MKTKRHAAALGMLVVLLIAGSGYVHLANASAQEQALAYGGSIEPLLSVADHLRAFFMDRDFLLAHGMSVPNVNGMCILILYQALLFNIVEDYRNRTLSSYSLWQYRQSRSRFILSYIKEALLVHADGLRAVLLFCRMCGYGYPVCDVISDQAVYAADGTDRAVQDLLSVHRKPYHAGAADRLVYHIAVCG